MAPCPICHTATEESRQAFTDGCFHLFCYDCIVNWSEQRVAKNATLQCPLCRAEYRSVFYNCVLETFSRRWFRGHDDEDWMTAAHVARRSVYFSGEPSKTSQIDAPVASVLKPRSVDDGQAQLWMRRELQALLWIGDVEMLIGVVMHVMRGTSREETDEKLAAALRPFLQDNASPFVRELRSFLSSGLNVDGYDAYLKTLS